MQEERVGECLGLTAWEIPALPSQGQQPPDPLGCVLSPRLIPQPNTQGSSHLLASQVKNRGLGAWASSQDHVLVRAGVGSKPWSQFLWSPRPSRPPQAVARPSDFSCLPFLSATRCLWGEKKQARGRKGSRRTRSTVGLLWGLLRTDSAGAGISVQSQRLPREGRALSLLLPWGLLPSWTCQADQLLAAAPSEGCTGGSPVLPYTELSNSLQKSSGCPSPQPSLCNPSNTYSPFASDSNL